MEAHKKVNKSVHTSVLKQEALELLAVQPGAWYIDGTFGGGGHTRAILEQGGCVLAIDQDEEAISRGKSLFESEEAEMQGHLILVQSQFSKMDDVAKAHGIEHVSGVLLDLGLSSDQLNDADRGFSFMRKGPLDMRMDTNLQVKARDLLQGLAASELELLFRRYGEVPRARSIAQAIVRERGNGFESTEDVRTLIEHTVGQSGPRKIHPATLVFQALRIAVNNEIGELEKGLDVARRLLSFDGRLVVISFHSLEDRIVKTFIRSHADLEELTKKPIQPSTEEITINSRARSARLRGAIKHEIEIQQDNKTSRKEAG